MEAVVDADSISVAIRIRPLSDIEIAAGHVAIFQCIPKVNQIGQLKDGQFLAGQTFEFDKVYDENATTSQIYVSSARALVADVVSGINGTIFACT
jgi:Kinesin motor domain